MHFLIGAYKNRLIELFAKIPSLSFFDLIGESSILYKQYRLDTRRLSAYFWLREYDSKKKQFNIFVRASIVLTFIFLWTALFPNPALSAAKVSDSLVAQVSEKDELLLFFEEKELLIETAAKHKQKLKEAPSSVTVITKEDIERSPHRNLAELLETVVGYDVTYNGNLRKGTIAARGLSGSSAAKRVLFLVDGRPVNRASDGAFDIWFETPLNNIERLEIIRGPGSALYGPNAFSGVVNIITKAPKEKTSGDVSAAYGTGDTRGYDINFTGSTEKLGLYITAGGLHFKDEGIWQENETFNRDNLGVKLTYRDLNLAAGYNVNDKGLPQKGKYTARDFWAENHSGFIDGSYRLQASERLNFNLKIYLNNDDRRLLYSDRVKSAVNKDQLRSEVRLGGELVANYQLSDSFRLIGGIDARKDSFKYNLDPEAAEREATNTAAFLQLEAEVFKNGVATLGGRYDRHSVYGDHTSPRISFVYTPVENARFRLAYGEAFRAPEFLELYGWQNNMKIGDEKLRPEKIRSYEAGLGYTFSKYLDADLNLFLNKVKNLISFASWASKYRNETHNQMAQGIELELKSRPFKFLQLFTNYTYQETDNQETRPNTTRGGFIYAPAHKFNIGATGDYGPSSLTLTGHYRSERKDLYNNILPGYTVFNAKYIYRVSKNIDLSLTVRNIFDKRYIVEGHDPKYTTGTNANDYTYEGVSLFIGLKAAF